MRAVTWLAPDQAEPGFLVNLINQFGVTGEKSGAPAHGW